MAEMPRLVEAQTRFGSAEFTVLGITDASEETAADFSEREGLNFPVLVSADEVRRALGVRLVWGSTFYLVDPERAIVESGLEESLERLERAFPREGAG
ncbi:MAG: redoxin domain-containing protein [Planctomycetota bacterium]